MVKLRFTFMCAVKNMEELCPGLPRYLGVSSASWTPSSEANTVHLDLIYPNDLEETMPDPAKAVSKEAAIISDAMRKLRLYFHDRAHAAEVDADKVGIDDLRELEQREGASFDKASIPIACVGKVSVGHENSKRKQFVVVLTEQTARACHLM